MKFVDICGYAIQTIVREVEELKRKFRDSLLSYLFIELPGCSVSLHVPSVLIVPLGNDQLPPMHCGIYSDMSGTVGRKNARHCQRRTERSTRN